MAVGEGASQFAHLCGKLLQFHLGRDFGDGFELVAVGGQEFLVVAVHQGHRHTGGGGQGAKHQGGLVSDSGGGVLFDLGAGDVHHFDDFSGEHHLFGEIGDFLGGHSLKEGGHDPSGLLVLGHFLVQDGIYDVTDLFVREFSALTLFFDQVGEGGSFVFRWFGLRHNGVTPCLGCGVMSQCKAFLLQKITAFVELFLFRRVPLDASVRNL